MAFIVGHEKVKTGHMNRNVLNHVLFLPQKMGMLIQNDPNLLGLVYGLCRFRMLSIPYPPYFPIGSHWIPHFYHGKNAKTMALPRVPQRDPLGSPHQVTASSRSATSPVSRAFRARTAGISISRSSAKISRLESRASGTQQTPQPAS